MIKVAMEKGWRWEFSPASEPGIQQASLDALPAPLWFVCSFTPMFLEQLLGAKNTGRNKAQKPPSLWGSQSGRGGG